MTRPPRAASAAGAAGPRLTRRGGEPRAGAGLGTVVGYRICVTIRNARRLPRRALRAGAVAALASVPLLTTSTAFAASVKEYGDDPGKSLGALYTVLIFVGIPVGLFVVIALLVMLPSLAGGQRYRPGLGWWAEPVWFGGPRDSALTQKATDPTALGTFEVVRGGSGSGRGGSSARW
jgi:hypothetical protein